MQNCKRSCNGKKTEVLKILMIGNSFSQDTVEHMPEMAMSLGFSDYVVGNLVIGGCSINTHYNHSKSGAKAYGFEIYEKAKGEWLNKDEYSLIDGITYTDWDFITLQQVSSLSGKEETYNQEIDEMIEFVKLHATNKNVQLIWNMTWSYSQGFAGLEAYENDQMSMYKSIIATVQRKIVPNKSFKNISPAGTSIQNARTSYIGDDFTRDGFHLSYKLGRYISGLTMFCTVTGYSPSEISYRPNDVDEKAEKVAKESVKNALKQKFAITNSQYKN